MAREAVPVRSSLSLPTSCDVSLALESKTRNVEARAMSITITLTDDLVGQLRMPAQAQQLSVEQWALTSLGYAAEHPDKLLCTFEEKQHAGGERVRH